MKTILFRARAACGALSLVLSLSWPVSAAEVVTVTSKGQPLQVPEGQVATLLSFAETTPSYSPLGVTFPDGTGTVLNPPYLSIPRNASGGPIQYLTVAGPCTIKFGDTNYANFATFKLSPANVDIPMIPTGSVVIPVDGSGNYRVALESSTDLINWVEATPGTFGSGATNRFFRVRLSKTQ